MSILDLVSKSSETTFTGIDLKGIKIGIPFDKEGVTQELKD